MVLDCRIVAGSPPAVPSRGE